MSSCRINDGKNRNCGNISGVKAIYIANYPLNTTFKEEFLTFDGDGQIIEISGTTTELILYPFNTDDDTSSFEENYTNNIYEQKITLNIPSLNQENQNLIKQLISGSFIVITKFKNNTYFMTGISDSMTVTSGHAQSGKDLYGYNGYEIIISSYETFPAPQVKPSALIVEPPIADFTYIHNQKLFNFTNTSTDATSYLWDFGDGDTSMGINPPHNYSTYGDFFVSLTAFNISGVNQKIVMIHNPPPPTADFTYLLNGNTLTTLNSSQNADTYLWDFGDGQTSTDENPIHIYSTYQTYNISLSVYNVNGQDIMTKTIIVARSPVAGFTTVVSHKRVTLTNTSLHATHYLWDFGDGQTSTDENPIHIYIDYQQYTIKLIAYNINDEEDIEIKQIETLIPPIADYTYVINDKTTIFTNISLHASSYLWDFGDGQTSTQENPTHTYSDYQEYNTKLTVYNINNDEDDIIKSINIVELPKALFTYTITDKTLTLTNTSTHATHYLWDFGDGNTSTIENPTHIYSSYQQYTITLIAYDDINHDDTKIVQIETMIPPVANFTYVSDQIITLTNTSLHATSYLWDFGDGNTSTLENPIHTYSHSGDYDIKLIAYNINENDNKIKSVTVLLIPIANFTINDHYNTREVIFTNTSSDGATYLWDFGDGNTSTDENPTHVYVNWGIYDVKLTTTNIKGSDDITKNLDVHFIAKNGHWPLTPTTLYQNISTLNSIGDLYVLTGATASIEFGIDGLHYTPGGQQLDYDTIVSQKQLSSLLEFGTHKLTTSFWGYSPSTSNLINFARMINYNMQKQGTQRVNAKFNSGENVHTNTNTELFAHITIVLEEKTLKTYIFGLLVSTTQLPLFYYNDTQEKLKNLGLGVLSESSNDFTEFRMMDLRLYEDVLTDEQVLNDYINSYDNYKPFSTDSTLHDPNIPISQYTYVVDATTVIFTNTSEYITSYLWDFGDGNTSTDKNPTHIYSSIGNYDVILTTYNGTNTDTETKNIELTIDPNIPIPDYTFTVDDSIVTFTNTSLYSDTYLWDFGDGNTSTDENPTHNYMSIGDFNVKLTGNKNGNSRDKTKTVTIVTNSNIPVPNYTYGVNGSVVTFTNTSIYSDTYLWNFGDGNTSTQENPTHTYSSEDIFTVSLTGYRGTNSTVESKRIIATTKGAILEYTTTGIQTEIKLPIKGASELDIDWGDGSAVERFTNIDNPSHYYVNIGTYTMNIKGVFEIFDYFNGGGGNNPKLLNKISKMKQSVSVFSLYGCENMTECLISELNTTNVTTLAMSFGSCKKLISLDLSNFDTSNVTDMTYMFLLCGINLCITATNNFIVKTGTTTTNMFTSSSISHPTSAEQTSLSNTNGYVYNYNGC